MGKSLGGEKDDSDFMHYHLIMVLTHMVGMDMEAVLLAALLLHHIQTLRLSSLIHIALGRAEYALPHFSFSHMNIIGFPPDPSFFRRIFK